MKTQKTIKAQLLPSGRFRTQIVYGKDESGKNLTKSFTRDTAWEAIKAAEEFKYLHVDITPSKITVKEAVEAYIDSKRNAIAPTTLYGYEVAAKNRLQAIYGFNITDIKTIDVQRAINIDAERGLGYKSIKSGYDLIRSAALLFDVELPLKADGSDRMYGVKSLGKKLRRESRQKSLQFSLRSRDRLFKTALCRSIWVLTNIQILI